MRSFSLFSGSRSLSRVPAGNLAKASSVGAKIVNSPLVPNVSSSPLALRATVSVEKVALPPSSDLEELKSEIKAKPDDVAFISNTIPKIAWLNRCADGIKIEIGCLSLGHARILHMPGELFVEYQLAAKAERPDLFVAMAAYGDYGPGYICTDIAYEEGGYEAGKASGVAPGTEKVLMDAIKNLLYK